MTLSATERARYARQTLLPEIGAAGQARLCASRVVCSASADADAWSIARDYLERAGLSVSAPAADCANADATSTLCDAATSPQVSAIAAHDDALRYAASALAGAFAAVETIKAVVGVGKPAVLPSNFVLISEES